MADNTITVVGTLTRDPEIRYTAGGQAKATMGIAVNRRWMNKQTNEWEERVSQSVAAAKVHARRTMDDAGATPADGATPARPASSMLRWPWLLLAALLMAGALSALLLFGAG